MKIYVAGRIAGNDNFMEEFKVASDRLTSEGNIVLNPSMMPKGFTPDQYMSVCLPMLAICDAIYLLKGWHTSKGANIEKRYAEYAGKEVMFENKYEVCPECGDDEVYYENPNSGYGGYACGTCGYEFPKEPIFRDGEPCSHRGCLSHISHPCEGCGRIGGIRIN